MAGGVEGEGGVTFFHRRIGVSPPRVHRRLNASAVVQAFEGRWIGLCDAIGIAVMNTDSGAQKRAPQE